MKINFIPIGVVHSPFKEPKGVPIQPLAAEGVKGTVEVFPEYTEGLTDLEGFSHIILVYYFHRIKVAKKNEPLRLKVRPYMDTNTHGVFATRAPGRPNPIGISVVRLLEVRGNVLTILDIDIVDGTPLLDIKPYVPNFDIRKVSRIGWLEENVRKLKDVKDDGRFLEC